MDHLNSSGSAADCRFQDAPFADERNRYLSHCEAHGAITAARRVIDIGRPWLRFLGWWREPALPILDSGQLDRYVAWMRDERGFTPSTVEQWGRTTRRFLRWCAEAGRQLGDLTAGSIFDVANRRFVAPGIEAAHRGGHALRHACAVRLLAEGLTLKEIGDHLVLLCHKFL